MPRLTRVAALSHKGGRDSNEDAWGQRRLGDRHLVMVADGLGGHKDGQLAARIAVHTALAAATRWRKEPLELMARATLEEAHEAVVRKRKQRGSDMGCAAAILVVRPSEAAWAHAGDVRIYLLRGQGGHAQRLTADHSVAMARRPLADRFIADTRHDLGRNLLASFLGLENAIVDSGHTASRPEDRFVLCSDGFWETVGEDAMAARPNAEAPRCSVRTLTRMVLAAGRETQDNFTVAWMRVQ